MPQHFNHRCSRKKKKDKKKGNEKILEEMIVENFPKMGKETATKLKKTRESQQDKPKAHINQTNKDETQRTNIKSSKGKETDNTQGDLHKDNR